MPTLPKKKDIDDDFWGFPDFRNFFDSMDRAFENAFKGFGFDNDLWSNKEFQDELKKHGHVSYGYSARIGSEGKPVVQTWSNIDNPERFGFKPRLGGFFNGNSQKFIENAKTESLEYDPYVEFIHDKDDNVNKIIVDLPGIDKKDIKLKKKDNLLVLKASSSQRSYYKEIILDEEVDNIKTSFKNGILEITITSKKKKETEETDVPNQ